MIYKFFKIPEQIPQEIKRDLKTLSEEKANFLSHLLALFLAIIGVIALNVKALNAEISSGQWAIFLYSLCLLMVYTSSSLYHRSFVKKTREKLRIFDHISIYFLIAGSYTPIIALYITTEKGFIVLSILWSMALTGAIFKIFYTHRFKVVSTLAYLVMGWMAIFIHEEIVANLSAVSLKWLIACGVFYTAGTIFYLWRSLKYAHLIWHLFVAAGSFCHFMAVYTSL